MGHQDEGDSNTEWYEHEYVVVYLEGSNLKKYNCISYKYFLTRPHHQVSKKTIRVVVFHC